MDLKRSSAIAAGCGVLAVWLAAAATSGPRSRSAPIEIKSHAIEERGNELASEVARLRERLRPTTAPLQSRDLFHYSQLRPGSASDGATAAQPRELPALPAPSAVLPPSLRLLGIAEEDMTDRPVRTAIISSAGALLLVKVGDSVSDGYRVVAISSEAVELTAGSDAATLRLTLK
jgi:hypothetical protein